MTPNLNRQDLRPTLPWWRVPTAWLVMGGPAAVVVAGIVTAVIAVRGADPEVAASRIPRAVTTLRVEAPQAAPVAAPTAAPAVAGGPGARP